MKENIKNSSSPIEVEIPGQGIKLKQLGIDDAKELFELINRNRKHLSQFHDDTSKKYGTISSVERSFTHPKNPARLRFGIRNENNILVGTINLTPDVTYPEKAEVGYYLGSEFTGYGYMHKSLYTLLHFAFKHLGYEEVFAKIHKDNERSKNTVMSCGFGFSRNSGDYLFYTIKPNDKSDNI